ncbi:MAG: DoxX family protein [Acidobacteriota bacterium]
MEFMVDIVQVVIALGIFNVWILRFSRSTRWRGGSAQNMTEEFAVYGLPSWFVWVIGTLKISLAVLLLVGLWFPQVTQPAAIGFAALMLGAVAMHIRVQDPLEKSLPAFTLLVLSSIVAFV